MCSPSIQLPFDIKIFNDVIIFLLISSFLKLGVENWSTFAKSTFAFCMLYAQKIGLIECNPTICNTCILVEFKIGQTFDPTNRTQDDKSLQYQKLFSGIFIHIYILGKFKSNREGGVNHTPPSPLVGIRLRNGILKVALVDLARHPCKMLAVELN